MTAAPESDARGELYCTQCEKTFLVGERCPLDGSRLMKLKAPIDPFLGRDIDGRFTVVEKLGQGGMGAVYRAEQHSVGREVAIKVVNTGLVTDTDVIKRFAREAKLASRLTHPNAVGVLDFGQTDDGVFYLVMELVSGRTLDAVIKAEKVFKPERVVRIGTQILDALDGAHALSIIHRDLKPANVMLLSQGRDLVKVLDFGLAKSLSPDATSTTMTGAGAIVGTPAFMPPELATGMPCDGRADLYSLGCILYLLGSGRLPFYSESVHELLAMHGGPDVAPPMPGVPARLAMVVGKLLEKEPRNRFQTAAEALQALEMSMSVTTPVAGVPFWPSDTNPSLGPFPANAQQFAHLETPVPSSADSRQRGPSATEIQRIVGGETVLAASAAPAAATSQPGRQVRAPKRSKMPMLALAVGVIVSAMIGFVVIGGDDSKSEPVKTPIVTPMPAHVDAKPAVGTGPVETRADTKPAVDPSVAIPVVDPKPVVDSVVDPKPLTVGKTPRKQPPQVKRPNQPTQPKQPKQPTTTTTTPAKPATPIVTKPQALPF